MDSLQTCMKPLILELTCREKEPEALSPFTYEEETLAMVMPVNKAKTIPREKQRGEYCLTEPIWT